MTVRSPKQPEQTVRHAVADRQPESSQIDTRQRESIMSDLQVMVAGVGALGRHHARIISGMPGVQLAAVADPREDIGREIAKQFNTKWVADSREMLSEIDAASIVVPTTLHRDTAEMFLERGIPVMIEKPLADSVADGQRLVDLARDNNTVLQVGHVERFNPAMVAARKVCGSPRYIRTERVSPFPFRSTDIGVVHDLLIHDIDLVLDLIDSEVRDVQAFGINVVSDHEDIVNARLFFQNGAVADLTASRVNPDARRGMQIWSPLGCVNVDLQSREVTNYSPSEALRYGRSPLELTREPGADVEQLKAEIFGRFIEVNKASVLEGDALTAELEEFVDCVRHGKKPACSGTEALDALKVADMVLQSMADHRWGQSENVAAAA